MRVMLPYPSSFGSALRIRRRSELNTAKLSVCSDYIAVTNRGSTSFLGLGTQESSNWGCCVYVARTRTTRLPVHFYYYYSIKLPPCSQNVADVYWRVGGRLPVRVVPTAADGLTAMSSHLRQAHRSLSIRLTPARVFTVWRRYLKGDREAGINDEIL